jgi:NAD(P)-dependent dehydrogenase (short-subunit alcohol dehydrogenase family)
MSQRFAGKIAIVTGAGCVGPGWGNGRAIAVGLAREGATVIGIDRNPESMTETAERIAAEGGEPSPNSPEQFAKFIAAEVVKWGALVRASGAQVD